MRKKGPPKKRFTDIIRPSRPDKIEGPREIARPATKKEPVKKKKPLQLIFIVILITLIAYLLFYVLGSINIGKVFENAFQSLVSTKKPQQNENVFKKFSEEFKKQMEDSGLSPLFKSLPESFGDVTSIGQSVLSTLEDVEYLADYGLALALNQKGDLVIEKLENLKTNTMKIEESTSKLKNQPLTNFYSTSSDSDPTSIKNFDFDRIENFLTALIDWLKLEPEQHLLIIFEDSSNKFYSDITIKNASITNSITKNTKDKTIKFGGTITVNMPVIEEISQMVGLDPETQGFPELFPQLLDKISNADKDLKPIIYGKISNAFKNKEILISFPDEAIQSFFEELSQ